MDIKSLILVTFALLLMCVCQSCGGGSLPPSEQSQMDSLFAKRSVTSTSSITKVKTSFRRDNHGLTQEAHYFEIRDTAVAVDGRSMRISHRDKESIICYTVDILGAINLHTISIGDGRVVVDGEYFYEALPSAPPPPPAKQMRIYIVKPGDNIKKVAQATGLTEEKVIEINGGSKVLRKGSKLQYE